MEVGLNLNVLDFAKGKVTPFLPEQFKSQSNVNSGKDTLKVCTLSGFFLKLKYLSLIHRSRRQFRTTARRSLDSPWLNFAFEKIFLVRGHNS